MSRRHRSRRRGSSQDRWKLFGGVLLVLFVLGCFGVGLYAWFVVPRSPALDASTNCPTSGPVAITVVLVDTSDELPNAAKKEIEKILIDLRDQLQIHSLLEVRALDPKLSGGRKLFVSCNPGNAQNFDPLYGNPKLAEKRWKERFADPFTKAIPRALEPIPANTSPIMATIQSIALDLFTGRRAASLPKTLVVISDLIENSGDYSQYKGEYSFQKFRQTLHYRNTRTSLNGAEVIIHYIDRPAARGAGSVEHQIFWKQWFEDNGGDWIKATRLQGVR